MRENLQDEKVVFFTKFAGMLSNGIPIEKILVNLEKESTNESLKKAVKKMDENIKAKKPLSEAMQIFPDVFEKGIIQLTKAGEETGVLDLVFKIMPEYLLFSRFKEWKK